MSKYAGFQSVEMRKPKRSSFDLSHQKRLSTRMGRLTPCLMLEAIPGDVFRGSSEVLLRLAPLLAPIYDQIELYVHFYFVPNRLLWEEWEEMITGGRLGVGIDPVTAPLPPFADIDDMYAAPPAANETFAKSSLADYLGVPILADLGNLAGGGYQGINLDLMPFLAYQIIWYEYYRDRNFIDDDLMTFPVPSGNVQSWYVDYFADPSDIWALRTRSYMHDYFTSALPFTQRGQEVLLPVDLALSGYAPVVSESDGSIDYWELQAQVQPGGGAVELSVPSDVNAPPGSATPSEPSESQLWANLSETTSQQNGITSTINDFRTAYALQVWYERNAVAGSRYTESNLAHFFVKSQDSRLQRPEYIGGGRIPVKISEVVSTAYSNDGTGTVPLANLAGHGITYGNTNGFKYYAPEHGFVVGIMSIMNPPSYHQGIPRMFWQRRTFLDYPWPTFAKLGEQPVTKQELYASPANMTADSNGDYVLFGYQSRYADWKYMCNSNHGDFHDDLLFWTLTRDFSSSPTLGAEFVQFEDDTQNRIFAVSDVDSFWCYIHNKISVTRALPYFGTPNTLGFS